MTLVSDRAQQVTVNLATERDKAIALHDYVRDNIKFGYNRFFDLSQPSQTLDLGVGHCNPQGALMVALFREVGLEAYNHFVVLPRELVQGTVSAKRYRLIPAELSHCITEVKVEGVWQNIDSYILDPALYTAGKARLAEEKLTMGYGTHVQATNHWDGTGDAFSQFNRDSMLEDHGRVTDLASYFHSDRYRHTVLGISLNAVFRIVGKRFEARSMAHLDRLRGEYS